MWTWVSGTQFINQAAIYGEIGVSHPDNIPGSRRAGCMWESNGVLWIFGGNGRSPGGNIGTISVIYSLIS